MNIPLKGIWEYIQENMNNMNNNKEEKEIKEEVNEVKNLADLYRQNPGVVTWL